jgi:hypothetical protein
MPVEQSSSLISFANEFIDHSQDHADSLLLPRMKEQSKAQIKDTVSSVQSLSELIALNDHLSEQLWGENSVQMRPARKVASYMLRQVQDTIKSRYEKMATASALERVRGDIVSVRVLREERKAAPTIGEVYAERARVLDINHRLHSQPFYTEPAVTARREYMVAPKPKVRTGKWMLAAQRFSAAAAIMISVGSISERASVATSSVKSFLVNQVSEVSDWVLRRMDGLFDPPKPVVQRTYMPFMAGSPGGVANEPDSEKKPVFTADVVSVTNHETEGTEPRLNLVSFEQDGDGYIATIGYRVPDTALKLSLTGTELVWNSTGEGMDYASQGLGEYNRTLGHGAGRIRVRVAHPSSVSAEYPEGVTGFSFKLFKETRDEQLASIDLPMITSHYGTDLVTNDIAKQVVADFGSWEH